LREAAGAPGQPPAGQRRLRRRRGGRDEQAARARWDTWANPEWIGYAARAFHKASPTAPRVEHQGGVLGVATNSVTASWSRISTPIVP